MYQKQQIYLSLQITLINASAKFVKVMFSQICPRGGGRGGSVQGGSLSQGSLSRVVSVQGGLCPGWSLSRGVSFEGGFCLGVSVKEVSVQGVSVRGVSISGVSVRGVSVHGGSLSRRSLSGGPLSRRVSVWGFSIWGGCLSRGVSVRVPPYCYVRAMCILLECILVRKHGSTDPDPEGTPAPAKNVKKILNLVVDPRFHRGGANLDILFW